MLIFKFELSIKSYNHSRFLLFWLVSESIDAMLKKMPKSQYYEYVAMEELKLKMRIKEH